MQEKLDASQIPVIMCYTVKGKPFVDDMEALEIIHKLVESKFLDRTDLEITKMYGKIETRKKHE